MMKTETLAPEKTAGLTLEELHSAGAARLAGCTRPSGREEFWRQTNPEKFLLAVPTDQNGAAGQSVAPDDTEPALVVEAPSEAVQVARINTEHADRLPVWADPAAVIPAAEPAFDAWNLARLDEYLALDFGFAKRQDEVLIVRAESRRLAGLRLSVRVQAGAAARLVLVLEGGAEKMNDGHCGLVASVHLQAGAQLTLSLLNVGADAYSQFISIDLARDASLNFAEFHAKTQVTKTRTLVTARGPGASVRLSGSAVLAGSEHADLGIVQAHASPQASSDALYKSVCGDTGRSVFRGLIDVHPGASGTNAYLSNRNLLRSDTARADSFPQLAILNNDLRCTHGSTTGKINPEQVFYLQSRGFSKTEAEALIAQAFLEETISRLDASVQGLARELAKVN